MPKKEKNFKFMNELREVASINFKTRRAKVNKKQMEKISKTTRTNLNDEPKEYDDEKLAQLESQTEELQDLQEKIKLKKSAQEISSKEDFEKKKKNRMN